MDDNRLKAAAHIARWRGWTKRHYSILEHMILGAAAMEDCGFSRDAQAWFLLHDMHETEVIGDVPTPHKALYCNDAFHADCDKFDRDLQYSYGLIITDAVRADVARVDEACAVVEYTLMSTRKHPDVPAYTGSALQKAIAERLRNKQPHAWTLVSQWNDHARRIGLNHVV
jgi:hypothetical protein